MGQISSICEHGIYPKEQMKKLIKPLDLKERDCQKEMNYTFNYQLCYSYTIFKIYSTYKVFRKYFSSFQSLRLFYIIPFLSRIENIVLFISLVGIEQMISIFLSQLSDNAPLSLIHFPENTRAQMINKSDIIIFEYAYLSIFSPILSPLKNYQIWNTVIERTS